MIGACLRHIALGRLRAALLMGGVVAALGVSAPSAPQAQTEWVNPDVIALRDEVRRLEAEVSALRAGAPSPSGGADFLLRMDRVEESLRIVTGRLEQLEFAQRRQADEQRAAINRLGFRVDALEGRPPGGPEAYPGPAASNALTAPGGAEGAYTASGAEIAAGIGVTVPPTPLPQGTPVPAAPAQGGQLAGGQLSSGQLGGAPVQGDGSIDFASGVEVDASGRLQPAQTPSQAPLGSAPVQYGAAAGSPPQVLGEIPATGVPVESQDPLYAAPTQQGIGGVPAQSVAGGGADFAYREAVERVRAGAFEDAERLLRSFIDAYPTDPRVGEAKYWLGETHFVRGQYADSARVFLDAYRRHPDSARAPDSLLKLGMTLAQLNQRDEACLTFNEVTTQYPGAPTNVRNRARMEAERAGCQ